MEEISRQLQDEILALQDHIFRVEDHFLATAWIAQILPPFKSLEPRLTPEDLGTLLSTLQRVQAQFSVNGKLAPQIAALVERYPDLLRAAAAAPEWTPQFLEETATAPEQEEAVAEGEGESEERVISWPGPGGEDIDDLLDAAEVLAGAAPPKPASASAPATPPEKSKPKAKPAAQGDDSEDLSGLSLGLITAGHSPRRAPQPAAGPKAAPAGPVSSPAAPPERAPVQLVAPPSAPPQRAVALPGKASPSTLSLLRIGLDALPAQLHLSLPSQDLPQFEVGLSKKLSSRLMESLRERAAGGSYVLLPRVARFIYQGTLYPCTARVLAKIFRPFFGELQDVMRFRNCAFLNEMPEPGWALITPEALPATLGKSYLDQHQDLRHLADELGVIPRLVRRRSLVEALYDLIAVRLVLGERFQQRTVDWTSSSSTAADGIGVYFSADGIRFKDLARTVHHPVLGACPSL